MCDNAGYLASEIAGNSWENLVQQQIFNPLKMFNTFTNMTAVMDRGDYATPYFTLANGSVVPIPLESESAIHNEGPAGIISSTVADMLNWAQSLF